MKVEKITKGTQLREYGDKERCVLYTGDKEVVYILGPGALTVNTYEEKGVDVAWDLYFPLERWSEIVERATKIVVEGERVDLTPAQKAWITRRLR